MKKEEAINILKEFIDTYITCHGEEDIIAVSIDNVDVEAFHMAIKALEQELEAKNDLEVDCISRKAVLEIYDEWFATCNIADKKESPKAKINALPYVTPIRPKGHWVKEKSVHGWNGYSYQCSVCGRSIHLDTAVEDLADYPYCHCGAEMREVGE